MGRIVQLTSTLFIDYAVLIYVLNTKNNPLSLKKNFVG